MLGLAGPSEAIWSNHYTGSQRVKSFVRGHTAHALVAKPRWPPTDQPEALNFPRAGHEPAPSTALHRDLRASRAQWLVRSRGSGPWGPSLLARLPDVEDGDEPETQDLLDNRWQQGPV